MPLQQQRHIMNAIGYVTIGAADAKKSGAFYDAVFEALGSERKFESGGWLGYGRIGPGKRFKDSHTAECPQFHRNQDRAGNGNMSACGSKAQESVKAALAARMRNGRSEEGSPGFRPPE